MKKIIAAVALVLTLSQSLAYSRQEADIQVVNPEQVKMQQTIEIQGDNLVGTTTRELRLRTEDGETIAAEQFDSGHRDSVLIICPGWRMTKESFVFQDMAQDFFKTTDVISMDFRGHGKSSGRFTFSAKEYLDLKAVVDYAKQKYSHVSVMGFSLGAATSIIYASQYKNVDNVIAVSPPSEFRKIENHFYRKESIISNIKKFELNRVLSVRPGNIFAHKIKPIDVVQSVAPIPLLIVAGGKDPTIFPWHAAALYKKAQGDKSIKVYDNDSHAEDIYMQSHDSFVNLCENWLAKR